MRYILIIFILIFFNSCALKTLPAINYYNIDSYDSLHINSPYKNKILKISYPLSITRALGYKIYYEYKNGESGYYLNSQWQSSLDKEIYANIIKSLSLSNIFKAVIPFESSIREDYRLESTVYKFKNYIENNKSYAILKIEFMLEDMNNKNIIKRKIFSYKKEAKELNAKAYIQAVNEIFKNLDKDLIIWIIQ